MVNAWHEKFGSEGQEDTVGPKETNAVAFVFKARRSYNTAALQ